MIVKKNIIINIDFENISCKEDIFKIFKEKLNYPDYFSYNWDSFYECYLDFLLLSKSKIKIKNIDKTKIKKEDLDIFFQIIKEN